MKLLLAFIAISLVILECQAGINRRWIQNPGLGAPPQQDMADVEDALDADLDLNDADLDAADLVRRDAAGQQQQQGQEQDAEFPEAPSQRYEQSQQSEQDNQVDFSQQQSDGQTQVGDKYEQQSGGGIDQGLIGQVPSQESGQYAGQESGYEQGPVEQVPSGGEYNQVDAGQGKGQDEARPWYKKVGRFFKDQYSYVRDRLGRKRRNDYYLETSD